MIEGPMECSQAIQKASLSELERPRKGELGMGIPDKGTFRERLIGGK